MHLGGRVVHFRELTVKIRYSSQKKTGDRSDESSQSFQTIRFTELFLNYIITIQLRCQTPVASDPYKQVRWSTRDVGWQAFLEANKESVGSFHGHDMHLRLRIRRPNRAMISAAAKYVGKSQPAKKTKPWSTLLTQRLTVQL